MELSERTTTQGTNSAETLPDDYIVNPFEVVGIAWEGVARNKVRSLLTLSLIHI